jgi:hypothetical protein
MVAVTLAPGIGRPADFTVPRCSAAGNIEASKRKTDADFIQTLGSSRNMVGPVRKTLHETGNQFGNECK